MLVLQPDILAQLWVPQKIRIALDPIIQSNRLRALNYHIIHTRVAAALVHPGLDLDPPLVHSLDEVDGHVPEPAQVHEHAADESDRGLHGGIDLNLVVALYLYVLQVEVGPGVLLAEVGFAE